MINQSVSQGLEKHRSCVICWSHVIPLVGLALLTLACPVNLPAGPTHEIRRGAVLLEPGKPVETAVSGGETYTYRMHVKTGQFLHVVVNQLGAHVRLELYGPDGWIAATENQNGTMGLQQISTIAKSTGYYALRLIAEDENAPPGSCRILLEPLHLPNNADYSRILAERRFTDAGSMEPGRRAVLKYKSTLSLWRSAADSYEEAMTLNSIADIDHDLGASKEALDYYNQALILWRSVGDQFMELYALNWLGKLDFESGDTVKALRELNDALSLAQQIGDRGEEATSLDNLGEITDFRGDPEKALEDFEQVLKIESDLGEDEKRAETLSKIAGVYSELGVKQKALTYYQQAFSLALQVGEVSEQATISNNIALVLDDLNKKQEALRRYQHALLLWRRIGQRKEEAKTLNNIGFLYHRLGDDRTALRYYRQALPISRAKGDPYNEAMALHNIGVASDDLGQTEVARTNEMQALNIFETMQDLLDEGLAMSDLMLHEKKVNNLPLAIFFGKEAVNVYQQVRRKIQDLDSGVQKFFILSKEDTYRELADALISERRLAEAVEVLDLLKLEEYSDYIHHRGAPDSQGKPVTLTRSEQIVADGQRLYQLSKISRRTPEEEREYEVLLDNIRTDNQSADKYVNQLYKELGNGFQARTELRDEQDKIVELRGLLENMEPGTVGLYTLVLENQCTILVITQTVQVPHTIPIPRNILYNKVTELVQSLSNLDSQQDFLEKSEALYNILLKPLEGELEQAHAKTLLWSLNDVLRFIPFAALYDGKQYLAERFSNVLLMTPSPDLEERPQLTAWRGLAMGVSKNYDGSGELPRVPGELEAIITSPDIKNSHGPVPGAIILDDDFTENNMEAALEQHPALVHIATHFVLSPGDDQKSYLLLGGKEIGGAGYHLSLADFREDVRIHLSGVELLTFSDCKTALDSLDSDGREIDSLAITALHKRAKAVVATLWDVDDASTGIFMREFYRLWTTNAGMSKAEALRLAQLELLHGDLRGQPGVNSQGATVDGKSGTQALGEAHAQYSNPFYWAPFVLFGNWN